jgi:hypothetical protein
MADMDEKGLGKLTVSPEELGRRNRLRAAFQIAFTGDAGLTVLEEIGEILHFFGPAYNEQDMALQNAMKSILHRLGVWGDADGDRRAILRRLRMAP